MKNNQKDKNNVKRSKTHHNIPSIPGHDIFSRVANSHAKLLRSITPFLNIGVTDKLNKTLSSFSFHHFLPSSFRMTALDRVFLNMPNAIDKTHIFRDFIPLNKPFQQINNSLDLVNSFVRNYDILRSKMKIDKQLLGTKLFIDTFLKQPSPFIERQYSELKNSAKEVSDLDFQFNNDGTVTAEENTYKLSEVQSLVDRFIENLDFGSRLQTIEEGINRLSREAKKTKNPIVQQFIIGLVIWFLTTFLIGPRIIEFQNKKSASQSKRVVRALKKEFIKPEFENIDFSHIRIVATTCLNVREENNRRSTIIGKIYLGNVVTVVERRKSWTLVEWVSEDNELKIKGWVYSRYLEKLK